MSVWFITGASRGFGLELAKAALDGGDSVVAAARDPQHVAVALPDADDMRLLPVQLDVHDAGQAAVAVRRAVDAFGRIDLVVNNAGYGLFGGVEEISDAEARALFDTNVFGLLNVTRAVLPTLRAQRSGRLVNIGSSAGFAAGAGRGLYGASKFAVEGLSEALRDELAPLGIRVVLVEFGSFRTDFLSADSVRKPAVGLDDYAATSGQVLETIAKSSGLQPGDPVKAVAALHKVLTGDAPPFRLQLGSDCVRLVESKLESVARELDAWRDLALSTDIADE